MKRFIVFLCLILLSATIAYAQSSYTANSYQTWQSVTTTTQTVTLPYPSRNVFIHNGSATDICISLKGEAITPACASPGHIQLDGPGDLSLYDFVTDSISLRTISGTASPVTVLTTY